MKIIEAKSIGSFDIVRALARDPERNLYALSNLTKDPKNTRLHVCLREGKLDGYLLLYSGLAHPVAILETESEELASRLLDVIRWKQFVIFGSPRIFSSISKKFNVTWSCLESVLTARKLTSKRVHVNYVPVRLDVSDAKKLLALYPSDFAGSRSLEGYQEWLKNNTIYGIFSGSRLVSVAGTYVETEYGWIFGALFTDPAHRRKGFATAITTKLVEEALKNSSFAMTYVVSTNENSMKILHKLEFDTVRETVFADIGTNFRPLGVQ